MNETIPFKKDILFKTKISNITDISLEHDYKILDDLVEGDFILEGTYKITEASVINEDFFYKILFSIAITDRYKKETLNLSIKDFSYEIKNNDTLVINVELILNCEQKDEEEQIIEEVLKEEVEDINQEEDIREIPKELIDDEIKDIEINSIIDSVKEKNDFVTYKIYLAKENDNLETISIKYNVKIEELKKYNNASEINIGDKIIIPYSFNE